VPCGPVGPPAPVNSGVRLMEFSSLTGKRLLSVQMMSVGTHPAWVDESSPQIATYAATLELAGSSCVQVHPCEVPIANAYPALGIELREWLGPAGIQRWENGDEYAVTAPEDVQQLLPATIEKVRPWDSMGEGRISALDIVLSTGATLTLRHVFPPMMLGVDIHNR
jgi:hypothetical protein